MGVGDKGLGPWEGGREGGLSPRAQTPQQPRSLSLSEVTSSLATGSGPWERPWSADLVKAKQSSLPDISRACGFGLGILGTLDRRLSRRGKC